MTNEEVVEALLEEMRCCGSCVPYVPSLALRTKLLESVRSMRQAGCTFTQPEVELAAQGEETEAHAWFARYAGWPQLNVALSLVFDGESEWDEEALLPVRVVHLEEINGHLLAEVEEDACHAPCCLVFRNAQCGQEVEWVDGIENARAACA